jgi:hypothetical protein
MFNRVFDLPYFSDMVPGEVSLGVPVLGGAVQIGIPTSVAETADKRRLSVVVEDSQVRIAREDDEPLQFEISALNHTRVRTIGSVTTALALHKLGNGRFVPNDPALQIKFIRGFRTALWIISDYALAKQEKMRELTRVTLL